MPVTGHPGVVVTKADIEKIVEAHIVKIRKGFKAEMADSIEANLKNALQESFFETNKRSNISYSRAGPYRFGLSRSRRCHQRGETPWHSNTTSG